MPRLTQPCAGLLLAALMATSFMACEDDGYETGDGNLSYLRADFALVSTNSDKACYRAETDDGKAMVFANPVSYSWASVPDSTYRALVYYKNKDDGSNTDVVALQQVLTTSAMRYDPKRTVYTDPVVFESTWLSRNNTFLNLGLYVKTGVPDQDDAKRIMGMVCDSVYANPDGHNRYALTLYHNRNDIPEYYSARIWMSVRMSDLQPLDTISMLVNTFDGVKTVQVVVR